MFTRNLLHIIRAAGGPVLSLVLAMACCSPGAQAGGTTDLSLVTISQGKLKGKVLDAASQQKIQESVGGTLNGYREFLGIPYAAAPVGKLRWKAPSTAPSWFGTRDATKFASYCLQAPTETLSPHFLSGLQFGSEDCLYLNVYTPAQGTLSNLPVIVWIHGGGFFEGAGQSFDPSVMVQKANVIVVTINYRLGPLGFLYLPGLAAERSDGSSGNYAIMDQQAAFQWVQSNIAQFGGNPDNVTIGGESAGAISTCVQVLSPYARGLFEKAIIESGSCNSPAFLLTAQYSEAMGDSLANAVGCNKNTPAEIVSCMRSKSANTITKNSGETLNLISGSMIFGPVIDGAVIPQPAIEALSEGNFNQVSVLMGSNHDEMNLLVMLSTLTQGQIQSSQYPTLVKDNVASDDSVFSSQILADYPLSNYATPGLAYARVLTDDQWSCATLSFTQALVQYGTQPIYAYEFDDPNPPNYDLDPAFGPMGAFHSSELVYVFQNGGQWPYGNVPASFSQLSSAQVVLSGRMLSYWTNFASNGDPSTGGDISGDSSSPLPAWPSYAVGSDNRLSLTSAGSGPQVISTFPQDHQCSFWSQWGS